jgi:hypothetical protein
MAKFNFFKNQFIEKEELDRFQEFMIKNPSGELFKSLTDTYGIVPQEDLAGDDFLIEVGTGAGTVKMDNDSLALDKNFLLISGKVFDNFDIPDDSSWYWMKIGHRYYPAEQGTVSITSEGQLTGVGTLFEENLRGQSEIPTKIKFYKEDDEGNEVSIVNDGIYEVVSVANNTTAIISGTLSVESDLKYVVIGSVSLGTAITVEQQEGIYSYDNCQFTLVTETVADTPPAGLVTDEEFYIARIMNSGGTVTVQDKRIGYYWSIDFGVALPNKADTDAANISGVNITNWWNKLNPDFYDYLNITTSGSTNIGSQYGYIDVTYSGAGNIDIQLPSPNLATRRKELYFKFNVNMTGNITIDGESPGIVVLTAPVIDNGYLVFSTDGLDWQVKTRILNATPTEKGTVEQATTTETQNGTPDKFPDAEDIKATKIVDRGDPVSADFTLASFTLDNTARVLDLSSIVPSWASVVVLRVFMSASGTAIGDGGSISFKENGNTNGANSASNILELDRAVLGFVGNDNIVKMDSSQRLSYTGTTFGNGLSQLDVTVAFWM